MIRHVLRLAVVAAVIAPAAALADNPEADTETKSIFRCTPASGDFRISFEGPGATASAYARSEVFNAGVLVTTSKPHANGDVMRTGTRVKHLHCGDVTVDVRDGFYNSNLEGELGAADDFARLTITRGANKLEVSLLEDSCSDASSPRAQAAWGENPVQALEGRKTANGYRLTLTKTACDDSGGKPVTQIVDWP